MWQMVFRVQIRDYSQSFIFCLFLDVMTWLLWFFQWRFSDSYWRIRAFFLIRSSYFLGEWLGVMATEGSAQGVSLQQRTDFQLFSYFFTSGLTSVLPHLIFPIRVDKKYASFCFQLLSFLSNAFWILASFDPFAVLLALSVSRLIKLVWCLSQRLNSNFSNLFLSCSSSTILFAWTFLLKLRILVKSFGFSELPPSFLPDFASPGSWFPIFFSTFYSCSACLLFIPSQNTLLFSFNSSSFFLFSFRLFKSFSLRISLVFCCLAIISSSLSLLLNYSPNSFWYNNFIWLNDLSSKVLDLNIELFNSFISKSC